MAQVRCESCGTMMDDQRAVRVGNKILCASCAQKSPGTKAQGTKSR